MQTSLKGKVLFITGASRGIGKAIALRAAADGACIAVIAKSTTEQASLSGTIYSAAEEIVAAGGEALPLAVDIRDENAIHAAVEQTVARFGGIDILVNNASAINLTPSLETPAKRFDLMMAVNMRGTFLCAQACLPHLLRAQQAHILTLSPPLNLQPQWFARHTPYTMSKYAMSLCVMGLAAEFAAQGVAVNALWPKTVIATAALAMLQGLVKSENCRTAEIVADAAYEIFVRDVQTYSGQFLLDEDVLRAAGRHDFSKYAVQPGAWLQTDLFLDPT